MAIPQSLGSLLHSDQLRALREQADGLLGRLKPETSPEPERPARAEQGWLAYLPQVIEYASLFSELFRPKVASAPAPVMEAARPGVLAAMRPYVIGAAVFGALGYAAYVMTRRR